MSKVETRPDNDPVEGPVAVVNWGAEAAAGGRYQLIMDQEKTIDDFYYRDGNGALQLQPDYQRQISESHIDWWGVARDLAIITFGAIGGSGSAVLTAIGVVGGSGASTAASLDAYKKKKNEQ